MNYQNSPKDIIKALLLSFNVSTYDFHEVQGATVTLYKFRPQIGTRVSRIRSLKDEMAAAIAVPSVRIIAPMDDGSVGIEVPKRERDVLPMADIFNSWDYQNTPAVLPLAIGRTVTNDVFIADLALMPHLLVAGATGQGKSVGLNMILMSLLRKLSPEQLQLILIDPKKVELGIYAQLENSYLACPVITETEEAQRKLSAVCTLMDERYTILASVGARNIQDYNSLVGRADNATKPLPYLVIVIDEYADLVMTAGRSLEHTICRIAQKARAVGIHLIISTQRPDTKVVTGNIKANFPTRIAFRTTTGIDSRVILDQLGAERLTGRGDMLFFNGSDTTRIQCAYASVNDVTDTCNALSDKYDNQQPSFSLPPSPEEIAQQQREVFLKKYEEEQFRKEQNRFEAQKRVEEWEKQRQKDSAILKAHRVQLYRHFYGSNDSYMTLLITGNSSLKNK